MGRLILLGLSFGVVYLLTQRFLDGLRIGIDSLSFWIGVLVSALTGFISFLLNHWWNTATKPYRPQTVTQDTQESPNQVTMAALRALLLLIMLIAGLLGAAYYFGIRDQF